MQKGEGLDMKGGAGHAGMQGGEGLDMNRGAGHEERGWHARRGGAVCKAGHKERGWHARKGGAGHEALNGRGWIGEELDLREWVCW